MKKIKEWIRNKLIKFLGIDLLSTELKREIKWVDQNLTDRINNEVKYLKNDINHLQDSVNTLHNTVENVVHIGTDVRRNEYDGHSWAVICIEGKMNLVKFVDLGRKDMMDVMQFLKRYEAGRHCVDVPYSQMFYDGLFKFEKEKQNEQ